MVFIYPTEIQTNFVPGTVNLCPVAVVVSGGRKHRESKYMYQVACGVQRYYSKEQTTHNQLNLRLDQSYFTVVEWKSSRE